MFYEIRKIDNEEILIIYFNHNYKISNKRTIFDKIDKFIAINNIKWNGNKIIIVVDKLILGTLVLKKYKINNIRYINNIILNHFDDYNNEIGYSRIDVISNIPNNYEPNIELRIISKNPNIYSNANKIID